MKPLDLKIEWLLAKGLCVEQRGELLYIYGQDPVRWRVLIFSGNPSYRRIREGLRAHFRAWAL
jgi:hypothetical protein